MKAAIIATEARDFSGATPRAQLVVAGKLVIDHVLSAVHANHIREVVCVVGPDHGEIEAHCRRAWPQIAFEFVERSSSHHIEALDALQNAFHERSLVMTCDSIVTADAVEEILAASHQRPNADAVVGVCSFVGEPAPVWAELHCDGRILTLGPAANQSRLVATSLWMLEPRTLAETSALKRRNASNLSDFLRHLLECGYRVFGERVPHGVAIESAEDIEIAEALLRAEQGPSPDAAAF